MQKMYFISGTMCTVDLWKFVFPKLENIDPIHIDISLASSFGEINNIIVTSIKEPAIIVGFSLGGFCALNFAVQHPEMIKKLVVVAANANGLSDEEIQLRKSTIQFLETHNYKGISKSRIQQFLHPDNYQNEEITTVIKKMDTDLGKEVLIRQLKATSKRIDISESIKNINVSMLFITAEKDTFIHSNEVKDFSKRTQKGKHILIKNCGHMIPLEKPYELASILNTINY